MKRNCVAIAALICVAEAQRGRAGGDRPQSEEDKVQQHKNDFIAFDLN